MALVRKSAVALATFSRTVAFTFFKRQWARTSLARVMEITRLARRDAEEVALDDDEAVQGTRT